MVTNLDKPFLFCDESFQSDGQSTSPVFCKLCFHSDFFPDVSAASLLSFFFIFPSSISVLHPQSFIQPGLSFYICRQTTFVIFCIFLFFFQHAEITVHFQDVENSKLFHLK